MRICGIEIKSRTAVPVVVEASADGVIVIDTKPLKFELNVLGDQKSLKEFSENLHQFVKDNNIKKVVIKEGVTKGKFSSGSSVFKIEAILQLLDVEVELIKAQTLSAYLKKEDTGMDLLNLKKYQQMAYQVAYYGLKNNE